MVLAGAAKGALFARLACIWRSDMAGDYSSLGIDTDQTLYTWVLASVCGRGLCGPAHGGAQADVPAPASAARVGAAAQNAAAARRRRAALFDRGWPARIAAGVSLGSSRLACPSPVVAPGRGGQHRDSALGREQYAGVGGGVDPVRIPGGHGQVAYFVRACGSTGGPGRAAKHPCPRRRDEVLMVVRKHPLLSSAAAAATPAPSVQGCRSYFLGGGPVTVSVSLDRAVSCLNPSLG